MRHLRLLVAIGMAVTCAGMWSSANATAETCFFPGADFLWLDDPDGVHLTYAPDSINHHSFFFECHPNTTVPPTPGGRSWSYDAQLFWGTAEVARLNAEFWSRKLVHENKIRPLWDFDSMGPVDSDLPYESVDHENPFEELLQGAREVELQISRQDLIEAGGCCSAWGASYYAGVQWSQLLDDDVDSYLVSESEYTDINWLPLEEDKLGEGRLLYTRPW